MDRKTSREGWTKQVERWRQSGLSYAAFAREHGIKEKSLRWWRERLDNEARTKAAPSTAVEAPPAKSARRSRASSSKPSPLTFIEVSPPPAVAAAIEIVVARRVVRVAPGFDAPTLARVLDVLEVRA